MLSAIARTRPTRSPSQPNTTPPVAAPMRNTDMMTPNHSFRSAGICVGKQFVECFLADEGKHAHLEAVEQPTQERGR